MGTHPLTGTYHTKADFLAHTFARWDMILKEGVVLRVTNVLVDGDSAALEMESQEVPQRTGESEGGIRGRRLGLDRPLAAALGDGPGLGLRRRGRPG